MSPVDHAGPEYNGVPSPKPRRAADTLEPLGVYYDRTQDILDMATVAMATLEAIAKGQHDQPFGVRSRDDLRAFALRQYEQEYPLAVQQALVSLWGIVETTIEQLCVTWLEYNPHAMNDKALIKLRVRAAEFLRLDETERTRMLIEELDRSLIESCPAGIDRFEGILSAIGLGGELDPVIRRALVELYQIRNLYVHKGGIADRHFKKMCPYREEMVGEPVRMSPRLIHGCATIVTEYVRLVQGRLAKVLGFTTSESPPEFLRYPAAETIGQVVRMTTAGPSCTFTYKTSDSVESVLAHYARALEGWIEQPARRGVSVFLHKSPDGRQSVAVSAEASAEDGLTHFSILHIIHEGHVLRSDEL